MYFNFIYVVFVLFVLRFNVPVNNFQSCRDGATTSRLLSVEAYCTQRSEDRNLALLHFFPFFYSYVFIVFYNLCGQVNLNPMIPIPDHC